MILIGEWGGRFFLIREGGVARGPVRRAEAIG